MKSTVHALSPLIALLMITVLITISVLSFQEWISTYVTSIYSASESENRLKEPSVLRSLGNELLVSYQGEKTLNVNKMKVNGRNCSNGITSLNSSTNFIDISSCVTPEDGNSIIRVVFYTDSGIFERKTYLKGIPTSTEPFSPEMVGNLTLWLDASDEETYSLQGSELVNWTSKTADQLVATSGSVGNSLPVIEEDALDGKPVFYFDGNTAGTYVDIGEALNPITVFFVTAPDSSRPNLACIATTRYRNYPYSIRIESDDEWRGGGNTDINDWNHPDGIIRVNGNSQYEVTNIPGYHILSVTKGSHSASNKRLRYIGMEEFNNRFYKGHIADVIWFEEELSLAEIEKVEGYLAHKWGIDGELPSSHPYKNSPHENSG